MITHSASAISVRLPDSSVDIQHSKPLVRFLVWAQFAMPLWFVFLNAAIATDLLLSQLLRVNVVKLQAIHKWYLPVATTVTFTLALPLLIYHSEYQPKANVFSVQFPSALSVTLYYILAFDIWIAIGIVYCFVVVSLVVGVIVIKLRQKRAQWNRQNTNQLESAWSSHLPTAEDKDEPIIGPIIGRAAPKRLDLSSELIKKGLGKIEKIKQQAEKVIKRRSTEDSYHPSSKEKSPENSSKDKFIMPSQVSTFSQYSKLASPPLEAESLANANISKNKGDTFMSGLTVHDNQEVNSTANSESGESSSADNNSKSTHDVVNSARSLITRTDTDSDRQLSSSLRSQIDQHSLLPLTDQVRFSSTDRQAKNSYNDGQPLLPQQSMLNNDTQTTSIAQPKRPLLRLTGLPPQFTLRSSNRTTFVSSSNGSQFRIPTLALVRLLLYPLIPIISFTLMCVVRWVWFRSTMPSRWEVLNVVSGILRALEGFMCLIVFLLNPALNRSFREIRKRNTPVFSQ
ncbi:hypothetical protein LPJ64_002554 [Coemansia asiatica]|uniref:Uncharacterized protein n=1 Tax=Coemansia asiatica TaxID=1052880 RepID=A0A9W7XMQ3_9FUNG|nr:hypothetical protein LPJ64_002554 [Coemansia asiatica]KAJ2888394.1 hypothetical protein FB639_000673 [Coemansia asiatica]